jgi:TP901 family phage tail tape measure protein
MALKGNQIDLILGLKLSEFFNSNKRAMVEFSKTKAKIEGKPIHMKMDTGNILKRLVSIGLAYQAVRKVVDDLSTSETNLANVASLGVDNIEELGKGVQQIGLEVSVPLHDIEEGLYDVVSAGVEANEQINVLDASARAAKAGLAETTDALGLGSAVIKGYGKEWSDFDDVMDQAFQTVKLGQTTFPELAANLGKVVPLASTLKIETAELFGVFATLTGVTGNASEVATQFRGILAATAKPTEDLTNLMHSLGYESAEAAIKQEKMAGFLKIVADASGGSADEMTKLFGRIEAVNAVLALSGKQYDTFIDKSEQVREGAGAMGEAFEKQAETGRSAGIRFDNTVQVLSQRLTKSFIPAITDLINIGSDLLGWFAELDEGTQKATLAVTGFILIGSRVPAMIVAIRTSIIALNASLGPVGWLILGIGAAATAWGIYAANAEEAAEANKEVAKSIDEINRRIYSHITSEFETASLDELISKRKRINELLDVTVKRLIRLRKEDPSLLKGAVDLEQSIRGYQTGLKVLDELIKKRKEFEEGIKPKKTGDATEPHIPDIERMELAQREAIEKTESFYFELFDLRTDFDGLGMTQLNDEYAIKNQLLNDYMAQVREKLGEESELYQQLALKKWAIDLNYNKQKRSLEEMAARHFVSLGNEMMATFQGQSSTLFGMGKYLAIANLFVTKGEAIARAFKDYPWPFNIAVAAIQGALVAGQIANVQKVKFKPSGKAAGGMLTTADLINSAFVPSGEDGYFAGQLGEMVMNRAATEKYYPVLSRMNEGGRRGFAEGGKISPGDLSAAGNGDSLALMAAVIEDAVIQGFGKSSLKIEGEFTQRGRDMQAVLDKVAELQEQL